MAVSLGVYRLPRPGMFFFWIVVFCHAGAIIFCGYSMTKKDSIVNALLLSTSIAIVVGCVLIKLLGGF